MFIQFFSVIMFEYQQINNK